MQQNVPLQQRENQKQLYAKYEKKPPWQASAERN
jgi:hypothetical protein